MSLMVSEQDSVQFWVEAKRIMTESGSELLSGASAGRALWHSGVTRSHPSAHVFPLNFSHSCARS